MTEGAPSDRQLDPANIVSMPPRRLSEKPHVVERIFDQLWNPADQRLIRTVVTNSDVVEAIRWCNEHKGTQLSDKNPANFFKDMIRGSGVDAMWPDRLKQLRWTALQTTGGGNVLEFVRYKNDQTEAFPNPFGYHDGVARHRVQSLSMPQASKALGRDDETYLIQVAVKLAVVETHFALESPLEVLELNHLQMGLKLRNTEIDSMFSGLFKDATDGKEKLLIITAEAKNKGQRILTEQIMSQVRAAFKEVSNAQVVAPVAMVARPGGIYLVEFQAVRREALDDFVELVLERQALYELVPSVKGI